MGIIDQFRKNQVKEVAKPAVAEKGLLMADIFQDKKKFNLFGKFLEGEEGGEDLILRVMTESNEPGDLDLLEEKRRIFVEKLTMAEKAMGVITKENVTDIASSSPEFLKIVNLVGPEKAALVIQEQMMGLAFADEGRFEEIHNLLLERQDYKNTKYKLINDKINVF